MAEYIEREVLSDEIKSLSVFLGGDNIFHKPAKESVLRIIDEQPTADVVKVVRCENCKHLTIHNSPRKYAYCEKTHYSFEPFKTDTRTHFCGFGELKEREG